MTTQGGPPAGPGSEPPAEPAAAAWSDLDRPPLRTPALRRALCGEGGWRSLDVVAGTGSTNADLAARAREGEAGGAVLVAEHQSAGRGRLGRDWVAPPRSALTVSVLLRPRVPPARWAWLPLLTGLAVADALVAVAGLPARLKWPNDVLVPVRGRGTGAVSTESKVCGVLAEAVGDGAVVLGAGLNVSQRDDELPPPPATSTGATAPPPTSLLLAGAATLDRDTLLRAYLRALRRRFDDWEAAGGDPTASGVGAAYREACSTLGAEVLAELPGGPVLAGRAEEVDDEGRLVVAELGGGDASAGGVPGRTALAAADVVHVRRAG
ncbi:biotin--[acetyl-CoA-carboxylase] ligase [Kineococcus xinjiangensis]|uniref:biotin--[acetyl-CoA-carboxylase] ligase n=1 Tax=Kineococcus xinjiangensis TaxID=512762 RepID=UPI000CEC9D10|nr:biotin--[acetyl-CoA-carboxylase] ligase [Kineococcus xinjiangensis]